MSALSSSRSVTCSHNRETVVGPKPGLPLIWTVSNWNLLNPIQYLIPLEQVLDSTNRSKPRTENGIIQNQTRYSLECSQMSWKGVHSCSMSYFPCADLHFLCLREGPRASPDGSSYPSNTPFCMLQPKLRKVTFSDFSFQNLLANWLCWLGMLRVMFPEVTFPTFETNYKGRQLFTQVLILVPLKTNIINILPHGKPL